MSSTVETGIKEPIFTRSLRLKVNISNPLNKNLWEADTEEGSYITDFMSSELLKTQELLTFWSEFLNGTT